MYVDSALHHQRARAIDARAVFIDRDRPRVTRAVHDGSEFDLRSGSTDPRRHGQRRRSSGLTTFETAIGHSIRCDGRIYNIYTPNVAGVPDIRFARRARADGRDVGARG